MKKDKNIIKDTSYSNNRIFTLDFLKGICCILIVLLHFSVFDNSVLKIIVRSITAIAVPCFMSISGYLIFYQKEYTYKQILSGPFLKYFCIFIFWDIVYIVWYYFHTNQTGSFITYAVINSEGWHLWYLKVHIQILLIFPLAKAITKEISLVKIYSVFWIIFILFRFSLSIIPGMNFIYLRLVQLPFFQFSGYIGGTLAGYYPMEALGYYIGGGYFIKILENYSKEERIKKCRTFLFLGAIGLLITILVTYCSVRFIGWDYFDRGLQPYCIWIYAELIGFIALIYLVLEFIPINDYLKNKVSWFSSKTLGIYILHILIMKELQKVPYFSDLQKGKIGCAIFFLLIIIFCICIISILKKILPEKVEKYFLG